MSDVRLAVWGLGRHAVQRILPAAASARGIELRGVCARRAEVVDAEAAALGCRGWADAAAMLADPEVDVVYLATPTGLHTAHARQALEAGKHVWVEKPMASTAADTRALVDFSRARGLALMEAMMYLHHPHFAQLERHVHGGVLGAIRSVTVRFGIPAASPATFRTDPDRGGGAFLDLACYGASLVSALYPDVGLRVRDARIARRGGSRVDTDGHAAADLANGVLARMEWRYGSAYLNDIAVWGAEGSLYSDKIFSKPADLAPVFELRDVQGVRRVEKVAAANHFVVMLEAFAQALPKPSALEAARVRAVRTANVMEEIRHAAAEEEAQGTR